MSKSNISIPIVAERNRDLIKGSITSKAVWYRMHEAGDTSTELVDAFGEETEFADPTITGTTTNIWSARPGWFTPDPAAQNYVNISGVNADDVCALDTIGGGVLIVFEINLGNNPGSGEDRVIHYGTNGAGGYYSISFSHGGNSNLKAYIQPVGGSLTNRSLNVTAHIGSDMICAAYFDVANSNIELFANSSTSVSQAITVDGVLPGTTITSNPGLDLFARPTGHDQRFGTSGFAAEIRDMLIFRFETDVSADLANIVQGFIENPTDLPWALENM